MVGRELHTICPHGEDHQGVGRERIRRNGSGNSGSGSNKGGSKSWPVIRMMDRAWTLAVAHLRAMNYTTQALTLAVVPIVGGTSPIRMTPKNQTTVLLRIQETGLQCNLL